MQVILCHYPEITGLDIWGKIQELVVSLYI